MKLNKVKALITGGVSGLGLAVARKVVSEGGQAVLLDINDEAGAAATAELGDAVSYINTDYGYFNTYRKRTAWLDCCSS